MIIRYSPEALEDLRLVKEYISENLQNPIASNRIINTIVKSCSNLKYQPKIGAELSTKTGRDTDLRYIISGKYFASYRIEEEYVSVIRILDGRTNYMQILFGT